jgi:hypothetical protein
MYYVRDQRTDKIVYINRFQRMARKFINRMRAGLTYRLENDKGVIS